MGPAILVFLVDFLLCMCQNEMYQNLCQRFCDEWINLWALRLLFCVKFVKLMCFLSSVPIPPLSVEDTYSQARACSWRCVHSCTSPHTPHTHITHHTLYTTHTPHTTHAIYYTHHTQNAYNTTRAAYLYITHTHTIHHPFTPTTRVIYKQTFHNAFMPPSENSEESIKRHILNYFSQATRSQEYEFIKNKTLKLN